VLGKVTALHRHFQVDDSTLPPNKSGHALADGMAKAWELYGDKRHVCGPSLAYTRSCAYPKPHIRVHCCSAVVVMVVQPGERNSTDQRWLEYTLWDR
jgi:hypothetical protein